MLSYVKYLWCVFLIIFYTLQCKLFFFIFYLQFTCYTAIQLVSISIDLKFGALEQYTKLCLYVVLSLVIRKWQWTMKTWHLNKSQIKGYRYVFKENVSTILKKKKIYSQSISSSQAKQSTVTLAVPQCKW